MSITLWDCILLWELMSIFLFKSARSEPIKYGMRLQQNALPKSNSKCTNCNETSYSLQRRNYETEETNVKKDEYLTTKEIPAFHKNSHYTTKHLIKNQQTAQPMFSELPKENLKNKGATFFFTQVEPHRFEYRAMFQHHNDAFKPFVHHFDPFTKDFPPIPNFPPFPSFPEIFQGHKDPFPNFPEFSFPTLPPEIKRVWQPTVDIQPQRPDLPETFNNPLLKDYNLIIGRDTEYPKIFRFNEERINIEEFDRQKKLRHYRLSDSGENHLTEPENVKRDHLLILHGGIFTVKEPPLFNKHIKRVRKRNGYQRQISL
ncbi:uncharacterized protein LOC129230936 isoform X2 [Uloborus diversus]|uniref:uncharacterized protein LOC129230936 isoform X2 n=1 Tax=Uloborus diversus TaxID=327109 RepID=UPI0024099FBA|nr:uncharacterized protein LOC129230936 isoform X2 [Uloborus diversus]